MEVIMKMKTLLISALMLVVSIPLSAGDKHKKKQPDRGMLEKMEAVPCGARERGLTGLGSVFGSVGVQHVNSDEKLCPQYLFRTDEMEYEIRPLGQKHPVVLPVGHEAVFRLKKDRMSLKVPDGDRKKRDYQIVAARPTNHETNLGSSVTKPPGGADSPQ
jgi:hypothetical protein